MKNDNLRIHLLDIGSKAAKDGNEDIKEVLFVLASTLLDGSEKDLALYLQPFIKEHIKKLKNNVAKKD